MKTHIDIKPEYLDLVRGILKRHLPSHAQVWVFGSRVSGSAKKYSDLDIAIDAGVPLSLDITASLAAAFEESVLPYKVDIVDWITISDSFRNKIQQDRVKLI